MDVQKWLRKKETLNHEFVNTSWESLENLIEAALAQDRKEREKLPRWHCPSCGADTPMNDFDWSDTLSADLVRLAPKATGWAWDKGMGGLMFITLPLPKGFPELEHFEATPKAAVRAALQEIKKGGA